MITDDPNHPGLQRGTDQVRGPQNPVYLVLSEAERARGFVRPVRSAYVHRGTKPPAHPIRELTAEERARYADEGFVAFEIYPEGMSPAVGRFWTRKDLTNRGCGTRTTMGRALAETYARDPRFYGATYCCGCQMHLAVSEFVWDGTDEEVGS
jgi:hypothetical protein